MSFAKMTVLGNIGQDAVIKEINGKFVVNFSVAHNEKWKDAQGQQNEKTTWFSCAIWKDSREKTRIAEYLKAGQIVHLEGVPEIRLFDGQNGKAAAINITVKEIHFAGAAPQGNRPAPAPEPATAGAPYDANAGLTPPEENDLPF